MKIGICAPYVRGEVTAAALHLANTLWQQGHQMSWLAPAGMTRPVHGDWDQHVRGTESLPLRPWARAQDAVFWFDAQDQAAAWAAINRPGIKQFRIMTRMAQNDPIGLNVYDRIVIPHTSEKILDPLRDHLRHEEISKRISLCHWTTGINCPPMKIGQPSVLIYCDGPTWRQQGQRVTYMAGDIIEAANVPVCVAFEGSKSNNEFKVLCRAININGDQFSFLQRPPLDDLLVRIASAQCLVMAGGDKDWGLFGRWAQRCGTEVITGPDTDAIRVKTVKLLSGAFSWQLPPPEDEAIFSQYWKSLLQI